MKRTALVRLGLTSAMAAALTGCGGNGNKEVARCVDENNRVVDEKLCPPEKQARNNYVGPVFHPYHWYYGGTGFLLGALAAGGRFTPTPSFSAPTRSAGTATPATRGGFGSTAAGSVGA